MYTLEVESWIKLLVRSAQEDVKSLHSTATNIHMSFLHLLHREKREREKEREREILLFQFFFKSASGKHIPPLNPTFI